MMPAMRRLSTNPRAWLHGALLAALALGGCFATEPDLYPFDPPPNVPEGLVLLEVSTSAVESMKSPHIADELGTVLLGDALKVGYEPLSDTRRKQVLAHQIVTGMTVREVIWAFVADPARTRDQGPPGGTTLVWETPGGMHGRFWVRFDEDGHVSDADEY